MSSTIYICFKSTGEPYLTKYPVAGGGCIQSTTDNREYQSVYLYYRSIYLDNLNKQIAELNYQYFREKVLRYSGFHDIAAYGNPGASKRILGPICPAIYNFRKTF